jgi:hypothetical protein
MRPLIILGLVLLALGAFVVFRGVNYGSQRSVFKVGDFEASVEQKRPIPQWVGGVAIGAGVVLTLTGFLRRRDA